MGDSPWSLLDDHLLDELIHEDETSYDAEDLDLISSLRNLQLFSIMNREESTSEDFNDSEDLLDDDVPIPEFERATVLGRFELREIIGRGSFGIVYCAFDRVTRREVALKLPRPELRGLKTVKERFAGATNTMTCEAGVILAKAQDAAAEVNRLFPLSLGAEGSCTIGGNLSTNAGGTGALAYGVTRDLALGLEVVLADGRIWHGLNKLKKDNTGYDLKNLFIGAEGTLGIITTAVLKLFPRPRSVETALAGLPSPAAALGLFNLANELAGDSITSFEFMPRIGFDFMREHLRELRVRERHVHRVLCRVRL